MVEINRTPKPLEEQYAENTNPSGWDMKWYMTFNELRLIYDQYKKVNIEYYINLWKNYSMYPWDRASYIKEWQKNIKTGITLFFVESIYWALLDSDVRFIVWGRRFKDQWEAWVILDWIEYIYTRAESDEALWDAIKETVLLGTGFFKVGYKYKETPFKYLSKQGKYKEWIDIDDHPKMEYVSPIWLIIDKNARNIEQARYIIERKVMAFDTIEDYYSIYWIKLNQDMFESPYYLDDVDYEIMKKDLVMQSVANPTAIRDDIYRYVKEKVAEVFEVYQRWMTTIFINWYKYWPYPQIWPRRKSPYQVMQYIKVPNSIYGIWVGTITNAMQQVYDALLNSRLDNVSLVNNKVFIHITSLDPVLQNTDYLELEPWTVLHMAQPNALQELPISDIKQWPIIESDKLMDLTQQTLGTNWYTTWNQEKVERSAFGVESIQKASLNRLKWLIKSISKAMSFVAKYRLILSLEYTDSETFEKILWTDWRAVIEWLDIDRVINDMDFEFDMSAMKLQSLSIKMQQALQLLQMSPNLVDSAGNRLIDVKPLVEFLMHSMGMDWDVSLSIDEAIEQAEQALTIQWVIQEWQADIQKNIQEKMQPQQPQMPVGWWEQAPQAPQAPQNMADIAKALATK